LEENIHQKLEIHYYFDDDSHTMNAFVRNKAEKDLLEAIKRVGSILDNENLVIETEAYQEGGVIEILTILVPTLHYLSPSINNIITHHFTKNTKAEKLDIRIKEETLKSLESKNEKEKIKEDIDTKLTDKLVARYVSNFYKQIDAYEKVKKIGFRDIESTEKEYIVDRQYFKDFILIDDTTVDEDDDAIIEIISPVLKEGKDRWKGIYKYEKINFSMGDSKFKDEVIDCEYKFGNGFSIECHLQITITFDEFGDEKRRSYSVKKVYSTQEENIGDLKLRKSGKAKRRNQLDDEQQGIFNFDSIDKDND
jgi:hypothetical protein